MNFLVQDPNIEEMTAGYLSLLSLCYQTFIFVLVNPPLFPVCETNVPHDDVTKMLSDAK